MCFFIYLIPYFKLNFIRFFFLCLRTGVQGRRGGGGGYPKSVQVRTREEGDPNFADFERTYFMDGPFIDFSSANRE